MTISLNPKEMSLNEVHRLLNFNKLANGSFDAFLTLQPLSEFEQQELLQIRSDFEHYLIDSKVQEGLVKALTVFPLLRLAGFYRPPIRLAIEEGIETIHVVDEGTDIKGRMDVLSVNKTVRNGSSHSFWVLVVEAKNSELSAFAGMPQLLTYTYKSLETQTSVWGLATNGMEYRFVRVCQDDPPTYQLMPLLDLMEEQPSNQILQVLKAIRQL
jgi:hypothetical protein